jgi:hypothetical protein
MANFPVAGINRKPDRGFSITTRNNINTFEAANGYQRRKLMSRRLLRSFNFSYTSIDNATMNTIEQFYNARGGTFESFILDLTHFNLQGSATVKFEGDLNREHVIDGNNNSWFNVSISMVEV